MNLRPNKLAWMYFYPEGNGKAKKGYVLHHRDPNLKRTSRKRYGQYRIEDLIMLDVDLHLKIHSKLERLNFDLSTYPMSGTVWDFVNWLYDEEHIDD